MLRKPPHVARVDGSHQRPSSLFGNGHDESVDCPFGSRANCAEQLARANPHPGVDGMHDDAFSTEPGKHGRVGGPSPYDLSKHGSHGCDRPLPAAHFVDKGTHFISAPHWSACERRERLTIEYEHHHTRFDVFGFSREASQSSTNRAAHSSVSEGTGP